MSVVPVCSRPLQLMVDCPLQFVCHPILLPKARLEVVQVLCDFMLWHTVIFLEKNPSVNQMNTANQMQLYKTTYANRLTAPSCKHKALIKKPHNQWWMKILYIDIHNVVALAPPVQEARRAG